MITNIQALRAFAAINVVFFHAVAYALEYGFASPVAAFFRGWGASGVDVFFVISGFVMVVTQSQRPRDAIDFAIQRVKRIAPTYWFYCLLILAIYAAVPTAFGRLQIDTAHTLASLLFVSQPLLGKDPIVGVGWTLEYEMLFYLLFALSIPLRNPVAAFGFIAVALIALAGFGAKHLIALEFLLGMLAGGIFTGVHGPARARMTRIALPILAVGVVALCASLVVDMNMHRLLTWGLPSFCIVLGAAFLPQTANRLSIFLGAASYSIYLAHLFVTPAFFKLAAARAPALDATLLVVACAILSVLFGCAMYLAVEAPLTKWTKRIG